jgi:hypothetical protein
MLPERDGITSGSRTGGALRLSIAVVLAGFSLNITLALASITGSISGVVVDSSGAAIPGAKVVAINTLTGIRITINTDAKGFYDFTALPIGTYAVEIEQPGFKTYIKNRLEVDANSAVRADAILQVGPLKEKIEVTTDSAYVETQSTQMGEVIEGRKITAVPLNGRSFTDLLALQPGVSPYNADATKTPFLNDRSPSGGLNAGNQAISGQRETANGFMVNGSNVEEGKNNGTSIIPNLDSISEFRIITSNFDAEYGNYSGGQINVVTKSGTNQLHGDAFEFLRNTDLDARNYYSPTRGVFIQNQFGGTLGGPIKREEIFVFADYQGTRQIRAPTETVAVPSLADQAGNLSDHAGSLTGTVNGSYFANVLQIRLQKAGLSQQVVPGEPYYVPGCVSSDPVTGCVFPNALIPKAAWSPVASHILKYIPGPNTSGGFFSTSGFPQRLRDDKGSIRIDANTRYGMISAYYHMDDYFLNSPYDTQGMSLPGFQSASLGRAQMITLGSVTTLNSTSVNEFRFSYVRNASNLKTPSGGMGQSLSSLGFVTGFSTVGGIGPVDPTLEGVPNIAFNNFSLGIPLATGHTFNNSFQWLDNISKIIGTHSFKFGAQFHYDQINFRNFYAENGEFVFSGVETGVDFADFLIGAPFYFVQASKQILDARTKYSGMFFQDSWRVKPNLTLNYGVRWEFSQPWYDTQGKIETIVPGLQSRVFPTAPAGWVVPGDPGIPSTLAPTKYDAFSPRLGIAYAPSASKGFVGKLLGRPGETSLRVSFGVYFTAIEGLSQFLEVGDAPFGLFYVSPVPPLFESPYIDRATGTSEGQRFPFIYPPSNVSATNPDRSFNWGQVEPISGVSFYYRNRLPYAEHYAFSVERQFGTRTVANLSYVGNQAHKLPTAMEANPVNAVQCLFLHNPDNVRPGTPVCGPSSEDPAGGYFPLNGSHIRSLRPLGPAFTSNPYVIEIANSTYNSLQASLRHTSAGYNLLLGYTYSNCIDNASGLGDSTNPFDPGLSRGLCDFDVRHHFVGSYEVSLPFEKLTGGSSTWMKKPLRGWSVSGITTLATGLPITLLESDDNSLLGITTIPLDVPNYTPGHILNNPNPRSGQPYFNVSLFSLESLGQFGNSRRRFFHGPGLNNFDLALLKTTKITESKEFQFRAEAFNIFNHTQFKNPNGLINAGFPNIVAGVNHGGTFGMVTNANDPRIMQIAIKLLF